LGNRDWAPEISYWTAPWATPDLHDNFIEKKRTFLIEVTKSNEIENEKWEREKILRVTGGK
jgi:hypothetical protein